MTLSEEQRKAVETPFEDNRLQYFREKIYPVLFAPSSGDVPDLAEAYQMLETMPDQLDRWYMSVQRINSEWFTYLDHNAEEEVIFSDGTKLMVHDGNVPSAIMRIRDLEQEAQDKPHDDLKKQVFRATFYPKLAACSNGGSVPDEETARTMPTAETNMWYESVCRVNPHWFQVLHDLKKEVDAQELKKKRKRARR